MVTSDEQDKNEPVDPLAELARLIGQNDPFAVDRQNRASRPDGSDPATRDDSLENRPGGQRRFAQTFVGKAVFDNYLAIQVAGAALLLQLEDRIQRLTDQHPNSPEAQALRDEMVAGCEDLKARVVQFLEAASRFMREEEAAEPAVTSATTSLMDGIGAWWSKRYSEVCDMALFASGVTICILAGASGPLAVGVPGAIVGGKSFVDMIKSLTKTENEPITR